MWWETEQKTIRYRLKDKIITDILKRFKTKQEKEERQKKTITTE